MTRFQKGDTFELKEGHIRLLQKAYWEWNDCETGAPCIDPKRPYGNSFVPSDVADILDDILELERPEDSEKEYEDHGWQASVMRWHHETETALEIILQLRTFEPGVYRNEGFWSHQWVRA